MKARWTCRLAGLLVLAALLGGAYAFLAARPVAVTIVEPEESTIIRVFGLGTVEARIVSKVGFEVGGALMELAADHGDLVAKGDSLAHLDAAEQEARVRRAEAASLAAEMTVRKALANVERARAVLAQMRGENERQRTLLGRNAVSHQTAEQAQRDEDVATADLSVALSEVEVARAQVADAGAALAYEQAILAHHVLAAPFDAVVVERHVEAGTVVQPGEVIFTLMAPDSVWVLAYVDEARAGAIEEGQAAEVRLRSQPRASYPATVQRIGIESDRVNEERRVWVKCGQCPPRIHLGEQAEVWITVARLERALLVPEIAVSRFDGRAGRVWIVEDGRLSQADLDFGLRGEDARLEVVGGLPEGARIVAAPVTGLGEGRRATVRGGAGQ
ncbi:efflux RND transporter periplasmic adaptor subunit [Amaricoccus sp.]|uniref:efflux RND transporter periplasmic adaptor subunit n=1 Tax=Amaricoccus sp. TaxID=1872485 RepID=UPI001B5C23B5|nr:efflux RND transporter periplasmic adaptor subunit [Amaricoccus sp.]MBP7243390.1 efflux RND transporter periplasmic adaptor subunit [Amaricoccus sp.]